MSPVSFRHSYWPSLNSFSFQIHEHDFRSFDFQSSFVFSLLPHEEFWHRIPISEAIDYNQSCSYDRMCVGIGSTGTAIALYHGEHTPTILLTHIHTHAHTHSHPRAPTMLRALSHAPAGLDQGVSEPTDIFSNPSLHNDSDNGERRLQTIVPLFTFLACHCTQHDAAKHIPEGLHLESRRVRGAGCGAVHAEANLGLGTLRSV